MAKMALEVKSLTKRYRDTVALKSTTISVAQGKIVGLLGPTGAGKSTLINIVGGRIMPDKGEIIICGTSLYSDFEKCMMRTGVVPDVPRFYNYMSGMGNLQVIASMYGGISAKMISRIVEQLKLDEYIESKVSVYPSGALKRLAIAAALLNSPSLLVMDEALYGLDPLTVADVRRMLRRMADEYGVAVLISSHHMSDLEPMCDIVAFMDGGMIIGSGPVDKLKKANCSKLRHKLLLDRPESAAMYLNETLGIGVEIRGDTLIVDAEQAMIPKINSVLQARGYLVYEITPLEVSLDKAYYQMLKRRLLPADQQSQISPFEG